MEKSCPAPKFKAGALGTIILFAVPSKLNPSPVLEGEYVIPAGTMASFPPTESLPLFSPDQSATNPAGCEFKPAFADIIKPRTESTGNSTLPKLVFTPNSEPTNETFNTSPFTMVSLVEFVEVNSTERISLTASFKSPSNSEWNLKFFSTLVPTMREPSRSSTVKRGGGFVSAARAQLKPAREKIRPRMKSPWRVNRFIRGACS